MPPYLPFDDALTDGNEHPLNKVRARQLTWRRSGRNPGLKVRRTDVDETAISEDVPGGNPDLWLYRQRTVALLGPNLRRSIEVGRMPSLLGREFFRTRETSYGASTFENSVIFVHDVERSLEEFNELHKKWIGKIVLQQFSKEEAGESWAAGIAPWSVFFRKRWIESARFC
jgi:hypothetical protein